MKRTNLLAVFSFLLLFALALVAAPNSEKHDWGSQDWTNYVRIGAYGLKGGDAVEIVRKAQASNVFGIEVDNDIPGRYESFVHPEAKLKAIHDVAEEAHRENNMLLFTSRGLSALQRTPGRRR